MQIIQGDIHDPLTATFQTLELARLNDALKESGITDPAVRRTICETYFFHSGYFLDSGWFADQGRRFRAGTYFAEVGPDGKETGAVYLPDPTVGTMYHEYAHGAAAWLFDDHGEDASEIETGDANEV
ncbi:MAG: hypothetical protein FJ308_15870 [Planctomycetes bacterium]|nr:hypothetical protein [Planctomycetota bacterium]